MAKSLSPALKEVKILAGVAEAIMTPVSNQMKVKIYIFISDFIVCLSSHLTIVILNDS